MPSGDAMAGTLTISYDDHPFPYLFVYLAEAGEANDVVVKRAFVDPLPDELPVSRDLMPTDRVEAFALTDLGARVVGDVALTQYFMCVVAEHAGVCQPLPVPQLYRYPITGLLVSLGDGDDRVDARDGSRELIRCGTGVDTVVADAFDDLSGCENVTVG